MALVVIGFIFAVLACLQALSAQTVSAFLEGSMRVVIDAGHGGVDGGVSGVQTGVKESDLNLAIARELKDELEDMGFEVTMTRKTEAGLYGTATKGFKKRDMQKRKEIIQAVDPALIISIHQNLYPSQAVRGGQVFYSAKSEGSERLAICVQDKVNELYATRGVKNRKIAKGEYFMLDCYSCPSVLVECGFLSSAEDEKLLCDGVWQKKLAGAISAGVLTCFSERTS